MTIRSSVLSLFGAALVSTLLLIPVLSLPAHAQRGEGPLNTAQPQGQSPDEIVRRFAAKEKEFKEARENYTYRQSVKVQTLDGDTEDGEYQMVYDVTFDNQGRKQQHVVFAPQSTLQRIGVTKEDLDDIENRLPFVLTSDEIPEYDILYVGQQRQDELDTYVFDVAPKKIENNKRYFQGRIWVDSHDFQIVKTLGKTVPDIRKKNNENVFPKFTTWREQIDGKYWFPTYTSADDTLHFTNQDVHIREIIKYTNYQRFGSNVKITYGGQELPTGPAQPGQQGQRQPGQQGQQSGQQQQPSQGQQKPQPPPAPQTQPQK
jgi:hypothetical protein